MVRFYGVLIGDEWRARPYCAHACEGVTMAMAMAMQAASFRGIFFVNVTRGHKIVPTLRLLLFLLLLAITLWQPSSLAASNMADMLRFAMLLLLGFASAFRLSKCADLRLLGKARLSNAKKQCE